jgi:hypothetical protein
MSTKSATGAVGKLFAFAAIAFTVFLLLAYMVAGTRISTQPDQAGIWFKAGPLSATKFDHCVAPSTKELIGGLADKTYKYPAGQRTYEMAAHQPGQAPGDGAPDAGAITVLTKDNIELTVEGVARFTLDTTCGSLQKFHEKIGIKYAAWMDGDKTSDGWRSMLRVYLRASMQRAMNEATQEVNWKDLYNSTAEKTKWENRVNELLPRYVEQAMGDSYFGNYSLTIQKPTLPPKLQEALNDTQVAVEQNNAQGKRNETVATELQSIAKLVNVLGPEGYNVYQAIKDGKIDVMPIPSGSGVVVQPKSTEAPK